MNAFHAKAWLAWLAATTIVVIGLDDPVVSAMSVAALGLVAAVLGARGTDGRSAALAFKFGAAFLVLRVVLFALTARGAGSTTLFSLPTAHTPAWLGGFEIGGRVTSEVVAQQVADGLTILAFLACFGVFLSVVQTYRVLQLLPRFMFEAGLVVTIALAFVPSIVRRAREVRDAQRLRGHRFRGPRALTVLIVPVLADALERSLTLASSMESRGYGRARTDAARQEAGARALVLAGLLLLSVGGGFVLFGSSIAWLAVVVGAGILARGLSSLSKLVERTRFRPEQADLWDRALIGMSFAIAALALAARSSAGARWYAYPVLRAPAFDLRLIALGASIAIPVVLAGLRAHVLARASARHPVELETAR